MKTFQSSILYNILIIILLNSCTQRIYTSTTSIDVIAQTPPELEEKGDISIDAGFERVNSVNRYSADPLTGVQNIYNFLGVSGININAQAAISDKMSVGMSYRFNQKEFSSTHIVSPAINFFKNFTPSKAKGKIGIDVQLGIQYKNGHLFMAVDEVVYDGFWEYIDLDGNDTIDYIYGTFTADAYPLGYYTMKQQYIRPFIQPSFSYEHPWVAIYLGANMAFQQNLQYKVSLDENFMEYLAENDVYNPLTYYRNQKNVFMGEVFGTFAVGPPFCRIFYRQGVNFTSDKYQNRIFFSSIGIKSSFSIRKKPKVSEGF